MNIRLFAANDMQAKWVSNETAGNSCYPGCAASLKSRKRMLRAGFALVPGSGPTGLLGERGTVSPAGDLNFSGY
jgi:hypothetical protein